MEFGPEDDGYLAGRRDDVKPVAWIAAVGAGIAMVFSGLFVRPTPPPPSALLHGCYTSGLAPSLLFDGKLLHFGQAAMPPTPYLLVWSKTGIDVVTDAPVTLEPFGDRYVFDRGVERLIVFANLSHEVDGHTAGVRNVADTEYLSVLTPGVNDIRYDIAATSQCRP